MTSQDPIILGIESSCDDTSAAVVQGQKLLSNVIASQDVHRQWGGVVPELASRAHQQNIVPVVSAAIRQANIRKEDISAIAFTRGPGLMGSLLVGTSFAKSMAIALGVPLIEVNHMQGHILANFIGEKNSKIFPEFPLLSLTVSGGHTQIVRVDDHYTFKVLGQTIDDAAGEAFDKIGKLLSLPYPAGPVIDKLASEGDPKKFSFSRPVVQELDFSFSGLKTNVMQFLAREQKKDPYFVKNNLNDICAGVQHTIIDILCSKLLKASKSTGITHIVLAGGVSANSGLRSALTSLAQKQNWTLHLPALGYTTDNAAMIAVTGYFKYIKGDFSDSSVVASARYIL